jgi:predicted dehydrogenase
MSDAVALATRDDVDVIDVATPPEGRAELLRALFVTGKPIMTQKPLAYDLSTAQKVFENVDR